MKCEACNYKEPIVGVEDSIRCKITQEEHEPVFDCNCERTRIRRDKEARLLAERAAAEEALNILKEKLGGIYPDIEYIYKTLHEIREEAESDKLEELIK